MKCSHKKMSEVVQILPHTMWHMSCTRDNATSCLEIITWNTRSKATLKEIITFNYNRGKYFDTLNYL